MAGEGVRVDRLRQVVAWIIVVLWVLLVILQAVDPSRPVPAPVQALMMLVAGYLFAPTIMRRDRREDDA